VTLFVTLVFVFFAFKEVVLFIETAPVLTLYFFPSLLATANEMSQFGEAPYGNRV